MKWLAMFFVLAGVASPWLLSCIPLAARVGCVLVLGVAGCGMWCRGVMSAKRGPMLLFGSDLVSLSAAVAWIAVASYSAQVSKLSTWILYGGATAAIMIPALVSLVIIRKTGGRLVEGLLLILPLLLTASLFLARPARRFRAGNRAALRPVAASVDGAAEAITWVSGKIAYGPAPFTDTAVDTLRRGQGRCSGQANVLHKILQQKGIRSRIVHIEGEGRLHTLVEYWNESRGQWVFADASKGLHGADHGGVNGFRVTMRKDLRGVPWRWRGYSDLYVYEEMNGYERVTPDNVVRLYPGASP